MTKKEFLDLVKHKIIILDGATGTNLQEAGMQVGVCPEQWILEHKDVLIGLQKEYVEAGTDILYAPTFTANRVKLEEYGLADQIESMNRELVKLSKVATAGKAYVAADLTMTGEQLYPIGSLKFEELITIYKEQVASILKEGVDLFVVETMMSLQEVRAAVIAIKEISDLPIMVTLTFNEDGKTLYGTDPKTAVIVLQALGVDAIGANCSTGPDKMIGVIEEMKQYATIPIIAKPNAGLPKLVDRKTVFDMGPEEFAVEGKKLVEAGAGIIGGCCGTTPQHMKALCDKLNGLVPPVITAKPIRAITTERRTLEIDIDGKFLVVGERINPTGKKALQEELRNDSLNIVMDMVESQIEHGADILDINMGMNGINEKEMMMKVIEEVSLASSVPLCIDSSHVDVIEAALRIYPGRALINSISLEKEKFERLIPIAKKYGAMFILLPLSDQGLPKNIEEKKKVIHTIVDAAKQHGLVEEDIVVDGLVNTVGANKKAALETLETIRYCKNELNLATIVGLSNISFGLPERQFVNSTFLAFAIKEGLTMAIANPSQSLLMNTAFASDLLCAVEDSDIRYINQVTKNPVEIKNTIKVDSATKENVSNKEKEIINSSTDLHNKIDSDLTKTVVYEDVIKGNRKSILDNVKKTLEQGIRPETIVDSILIPAINEVGSLFDKQIYFLPQLISSAEAMKTAIEYIEPMLKRDENSQKLGTIVIATVAGDIHDIGKNLVALMLKNYGFEVIDLGKDVPTETIIQTAKERKADVIGLSALMTTTMLEMKEVVDRVKKEKLNVQVIIGGAVITQSYADEIGADGYSKDAADAVKLVKRLLKIN
ncbi:homocysteine S-methyltransferase family protein [Anaeromicropila herbilytica]|uniref:Methionine synthase n=1 Tax=Anaeromicropila herbilytica TaxID=2785025 RepID=A0A7R7ENY6_9FIRM|nr:homocysteine S-methyltransferase family protein [Anaeromicropila herbilytica]BCN32045.1 homocysteine S-methyltransferase [Anaeromicropila herbilytica]